MISKLGTTGRKTVGTSAVRAVADGEFLSLYNGGAGVTYGA